MWSAPLIRPALLALCSGLIVLVGCSSTDNPQAGAADAAPASGESVGSTDPSKDAGSSDAQADAPADPSQPTGTCPSAIGAFPENEYFRPMHAMTKGSCTTADIAIFDKIGNGSNAARRSMVSADCAKCVYADYADPTWGLLLVVGPDTALTNYAGCSVLAGDTRECVKMNSAYRMCTRKACGGCSSSSADTCAQHEIEQGQCKKFFDADTACTGTFPDGCASYRDMIVKYCGP